MSLSKDRRDNDLDKHNMFGFAAQSYDLFNDSQRYIANQLYDKLRGYNYKSILDLGCGTGSGTQLLHSQCSASRSLGLDSSAGMIRVARQRASCKEIVFKLCDVTQLNDSICADLFFSNGAFQWMYPLKEVFIWMNRQRKDNTRILFSCFLPGTYKELSCAIRNVVRNDYRIPADQFLDIEDYRLFCGQYLSDVMIQEYFLTVSFDSVISLLRSIKFTGTKLKKNGLFLPPENIKRLDSFMIENYGAVRVSFRYLIADNVDHT